MVLRGDGYPPDTRPRDQDIEEERRGAHLIVEEGNDLSECSFLRQQWSKILLDDPRSICSEKIFLGRMKKALYREISLHDR